MPSCAHRDVTQTCTRCGTCPGWLQCRLSQVDNMDSFNERLSEKFREKFSSFISYWVYCIFPKGARTLRVVLISLTVQWHPVPGGKLKDHVGVAAPSPPRLDRSCSVNSILCGHTSFVYLLRYEGAANELTSQLFSAACYVTGGWEGHFLPTMQTPLCGRN